MCVLPSVYFVALTLTLRLQFRISVLSLTLRYLLPEPCSPVSSGFRFFLLMWSIFRFFLLQLFRKGFVLVSSAPSTKLFYFCFCGHMSTFQISHPFSIVFDSGQYFFPRLSPIIPHRFLLLLLCLLRSPLVLLPSCQIRLLG